MIEVRDLYKTYGGPLNAAVDHISFTLEKGKIYGFLGPNGAGKSTTMNIMTGYIAATSGKVLVGGFDVSEKPIEARKHIGYLPEIPPLYGELYVREYLEFAASLKGFKKGEIKNETRRLMERLDILSVSEKLISNLSKGYRQRVGIAQALMGNPDIVILDEPSVGLDPEQIISMRELILELKKDHIVILSSHILSEISAVCDHILILSSGRLVADDDKEALEKRLNENSRIKIVLDGDEKVVKGILSGIAGVKEVQRIKNLSPSEGKSGFMLSAEDSIELKKQIFYRLSANNIPILEITAEKKTLEDIYLELQQ